MSPRAAWRLEAAGFAPVYGYVAGEADWLAADLPFEGTARLAGISPATAWPLSGRARRWRTLWGCGRPRGSGRSWFSTRPGWGWAARTGTAWCRLPGGARG